VFELKNKFEIRNGMHSNAEHGNEKNRMPEWRERMDAQERLFGYFLWARTQVPEHLSARSGPKGQSQDGFDI
jgi:hypothetical protein